MIGASWTALFLARGLHVVATDIAPNAEAALRKVVETAWPALKRQLDERLPSEVIIASSSSGLTMSEIQKGAVAS